MKVMNPLEKLVSQPCRTLVWFSCGACSTVALKKALEQYNNVTAVYCDTGGEHPDNKRFLRDVEEWLNIKITILKNPKYENHFDVFEKTKIFNIAARCEMHWGT